MYQHGRGVPQDFKKAAELFTLSANQGCAFGQNNLGTIQRPRIPRSHSMLSGYLYQCGKGVPKSYKRGVELYALAANQGYAAAQNNLGTTKKPQCSSSSHLI